MSDTESLLKIQYTGLLVAVNHERITENMWVPNLGYHDHRAADDLPGACAVSLFREAEGERALVVPEGLVLDCHSRDTHLTHEVMLIASPLGENKVGVTLGWFDVGLLVRGVDDERADNDSRVVFEALAVMAAKLNAALKGEGE
jgi:hypothetical protein